MKMNFFAGLIVTISISIATLSGCTTNNTYTAPVPSASPSVSATATPTASATPGLLKTEDIEAKRVRDAVTTLVQKTMGSDSTPKLMDGTQEMKGQGIKIRENLFVVYLPKDAKNVDFINIDEKASMPDKGKDTGETLIGYAARSETIVKAFGSGSTSLGRFAVISGQYAIDLSKFPTTFGKYDIVKSDSKVGEVTFKGTKNLLTNEKTITMDYSITDDGVRIEGDGYPVFMSKTSLSTPINSGKLEKLGDKDNTMAFNSTAYAFGSGGKTNPIVTLSNITWQTVLDGVSNDLAKKTVTTTY